MKPYLLLKRAVDFGIALLLLVILFPLFAVVALVIRADSPGPVIFRQERVGKGARLFWIYKFRTMYQGAPPSVATHELLNAERCITRTGRILRKTSVDELPQLLNILRGEMSLIGPRPLVPEERDIHERRKELGAYQVLPGMTGWAQVNGRDCVDAATKAALDAHYAHHVSLWLDLKILAYSILCVVTARGIKEGGGRPQDISEDVPLGQDVPNPGEQRKPPRTGA